MRQNGQNERALYEACVDGNQEIVDTILASVSDDEKRELVMKQTEDGLTCLHGACDVGNIGVVTTILTNVSDDVRRELVMIQAEDGLTCLHGACVAGNNELVNTILTSVSDDVKSELVMIQEEDGRTCLYEACFAETNEIVNTILESVSDDVRGELVMIQAENGDTCLHGPCSSGRNYIVKTILECVSDFMRSELVMMQGEYDRTCLYKVCAAGHTNVATTIHDRVSDDVWSQLVKIQTTGGYTAFHIACLCDHIDVVNFILQSLEDNVRDELLMAHSKTEYNFSSACERGSSDVVKAILDNISEDDKHTLAATYGCTALHKACSNGHTDTVRVFFDYFNDSIKRKLLTDEQTEGANSIKASIENEHYETLAFLCSLFPEILYKHITAEVMTNVCQRGLKNEISSILKCVSNVDTGTFDKLLLSRDHDERSLLHIACSRGDNGLVEVIVGFVTNMEEKSDFICTKDQYGKTALHECCQQGNYQLVQTLIDASRKWSCLSDMFSTYDAQQKNPLWYAFEMGHYSIVKTILEQASAAECVTELLLSTDKDNQTLIHKSCQSNYPHIRCVEKVINMAEKQMEKVQIDLLCSQDACGKTFLSYISEANQHVIQYLIRRLIDKELMIFVWPKPMTKDTLNHHVEPVCEFLISHSVCRRILTNVDHEGNTILHGIKASHGAILCDMLTPFHDEIQIWYAEDRSTACSTRLYNERPDSTYDVSNLTNIPTDKFNRIVKAQKLFKNFPDKNGVTHADRNSALLELGKPCYFHLLHSRAPTEFYFTNDQRNPLKAIGDSGCIELIRHPYTQGYLDVCWTSFVRYFFLADLILYFLQLLSLTVFTSSYQYQLNQANSSVSVNIASAHDQLSNVFQHLLMTCSILAFFYEALQMLAMRSCYWRSPNNYADLVVCFGSFIIAVTPMVTTYHVWLYQFGVVVMCIAWINFAWMLTKLTSGIFRPIGLLLIMFFDVLKNIVIFLPVLAIFILTASLSYTALLHTQEPFSHLGYSTLKTIAMATGELEFSSIFFPEDVAADPPFYALTSVLFVVFLGIMNIAVMNLLVGMAVIDIDNLKTSQSEVIAFKSQVSLTVESQLMMQLFKRRTQRSETRNSPTLDTQPSPDETIPLNPLPDSTT